MSFNLRYLHLRNMVSVCFKIEKFEYYYLYPAIAQTARCMGNTQLASTCTKITKQAKHQMHSIAKIHGCISKSIENLDSVISCSQGPAVYLYTHKTIGIDKLKPQNEVLFSNPINLLILQCILNIIKLEAVPFSTDNKLGCIDLSNQTEINTNNVFLNDTEYLLLDSVLAYKRWKSAVLYFILAKLSYCLGYNEMAQSFIQMSHKEQRTSLLLHQIIQNKNCNLQTSLK
uniref:Uncharacterized protein n=1 Tax=Zygnema circumcarinatum TaxID=35869 RepID=Q32RJ4_ZYGCR|nr:hypothetical protein P8547_pgp038 [Zygnema circumcarinatum]AAX45886.1 hypothetical protein [Zygnema circumcarinatum]